MAGAGGILALGGYKWYDIARTPDIHWLEQQKSLLGSLADTIIPPGDSPGASAAGAQDFMITLLKDCTDRHTLNNFIDGLHSLEAHCQSSYNKSYLQCSEPDRIATLTLFANRAPAGSGIWSKVESRYLGKPFFTTLKEYTVLAYCTSEQGATHGLHYLPVPGAYHGCLPWHPGQPAWATK